MLCPVLIGRSAELGALTAAADAAADGHGGAVFITGDAGIGKSRLAKDISAYALSRGFQVLTGRATESTVPVPYRPVAEALMGAARAGVIPDARGLADYRAAVGSLVPEWGQPGDSGAEISPVILGEAVLRMLTLPEWPGGLLVLQDLHWADPDTLALTEYLADNIAAARALCVITLRDGEPSASAELLQSALARRVATRIEVPRLTAATVSEMAAACLHVADVPAGVARLLADCDGLPFAVEEILAAAVASGELVRSDSGWQVDGEVSTGVPASIVGSVRNRLAALGEGVTNILVSAAILGRQFDWALLPRITGVAEADVLEALRRARDVQLIEPANAGAGIFRFRHCLTRDAIVSSLLPPDRASRSADAAEAIEAAHPGLPGAWCEVAAELHAAAGQLPAAIRLQLRAGGRALRHGAVSSAIAALEDARILLAEARPPEPMLSIEVDEELAHALATAGDYDRLAPLAESLIGRLENAGDDLRRPALIRLLTARTRPEDHPAAAAAHLTAAATVAQQLTDRELASRTDAVAARNALAAGEFDNAEVLARRALASATNAGLTGWAAEVALESLDVIGRRERARDLRAARLAFEQALRIADNGAREVWRIRALHELATIDMMQGGSPARLSEVRELARGAGVISAATIIELQLANFLSLGTDIDQALELARHCERSATQLGVHRVAAMAICLQANIAGIRADRHLAELTAQRAESILPDDPDILLATWGQARVLASLFRDDITRAVKQSAAAVTHGQPLTGQRRVQGFYSPLQAPLLAPRRALGLHALLQAACDGDGPAAIEQARTGGATASWNDGCLWYAEAVLEGQAGRARRATSLAGEASEQLAGFAPWWDHLARRSSHRRHFGTAGDTRLRGCAKPSRASRRHRTTG